MTVKHVKLCCPDFARRDQSHGETSTWRKISNPAWFLASKVRMKYWRAMYESGHLFEWYSYTDLSSIHPLTSCIFFMTARITDLIKTSAICRRCSFAINATPTSKLTSLYIQMAFVGRRVIKTTYGWTRYRMCNTAYEFPCLHVLCYYLYEFITQ